MTQNDLREKVINAEAKVAKRKAVLKKHREQLAKLIQKLSLIHISEPTRH